MCFGTPKYPYFDSSNTSKQEFCYILKDDFFGDTLYISAILVFSILIFLDIVGLVDSLCHLVGVWIGRKARLRSTTGKFTRDHTYIGHDLGMRRKFNETSHTSDADEKDTETVPKISHMAMFLGMRL